MNPLNGQMRARETPACSTGPICLGALEIAVQLDNPETARSLVQTIDVLRHQLLQPTGGFEARQRVVGNVRPGIRDSWPAGHAPRPVTLPYRFGTQKVLQENRRRLPPPAIRVAIARNTRIGADPRPGQDEQARIPLHEGA